MNRRRFLHAAGAAAAGSAAGCGTTSSFWRSLTANEGRTLEAVCAQIIPDDQDPGARQAGVVRYIDRQLAGKFREYLGTYREGLRAADRLAGGSFAQASPERQAEAMRQLEKESRPFFDLVVAHTMQGFYGNPRHGGNRDYASWRMLRIPPSPVRGRAHYDFTREQKG